MLKILKVLVIAFFLFSCTEKKKKEDDLLRAIVTTYRPSFDIATIKVCLIIPSEGCSECIKYSRDFAKQKLGDLDYLIIASTRSKKRLRIHWKPDVDFFANH